MENILKHIHADVGVFNGSLYFTLNGKLLRVGVCTPNFNDYGEWRLNGFNFSTKPYDKNDDEVPLKPYNIPDIKITDEDLAFLEKASEIMNDETVSEEDIIKFNRENIWNSELAGGRFKGDDFITIFDDEDEYNRKNIKYTDWLVSENKTSFENVFYPILNGFIEGYLKK